MAKKAEATWTPLSHLTLWDRNYRKGDVKAVRHSIERFGFNAALRVKKGIVYAGNHSLKALRELEAAGSRVPAGVALTADGEWSVQVISLDHLSDAEASAFAIADNRTHDLGRDDEGAILSLLDELRFEDESLAIAAGFTIDDLAELSKEGSGAGDNRISESSETTEAADFLKWSGGSAQLTQEEIEELNLRFEAYVQQYGTSFGFARHILGI